MSILSRVSTEQHNEDPDHHRQETNETRSYRFDYVSKTCRAIESTGARRMSLEAGMSELRSLPEAGWICR